MDWASITATVLLGWDPVVTVGSLPMRYEVGGFLNGELMATMEVSETQAEVPKVSGAVYRVRTLSGPLMSPWSEPLQLWKLDVEHTSDLRSWSEAASVWVDVPGEAPAAFWRIKVSEN